jgi:hypothetical protein
MKLTPNTIRIILEDFITKLAYGEVTIQDFDNLFNLAEMSGTYIPENVRTFLEELREEMRAKDQS